MKVCIKHNFNWNTKLFFLLGVNIYNLSNKKACVYNKKCVCMRGGGSCIDKYINAATWPSKLKFLALPLLVLVAGAIV